MHTETYINSHPLVSVIFLSYKRPHLLKEAFYAFISGTNYPREKLELILCDDGSPEFMQEEIRNIPFDKFLFSKENNGLGANSNKGIQNACGEYILQIQDDWILNGNPNYLYFGIKIFEEYNDIALIRYRLGREFNYSEIRTCTMPYIKVKILSRDNREELFLYSDNPHLKKASFHHLLGPYLEGKKMELTEIDMCKKFLNKREWNSAVIDSCENIFSHIGAQESHRKKNNVKDFLYKIMMSNKYLSNLIKKYKY